MNKGLAIDSRLAAALDRVRGAGLSSWLLAGAGLVLVAGLLTVFAPASTTPGSDPGTMPAGSLMGTSADAAIGGSGPLNPSALQPLLGAQSDPGLPTFMDVVAKGVLVLALLLITLRVLRRFSSAANPATARMVVLESRPLAQRATLHLVAIGERRLVLGLTQSGLVSLAELSAEELPEEVAALDRPGTLPGADLIGARSAELFARVLGELGKRRASPR